MKTTSFTLLLLLVLTWGGLLPERLLQASEPPVQADVCVYAATPGGILAAIAARREGHTVVIVEPSRWVGGMLGAGLKPMQDCPNYAATGGLTRSLLKSLGQPEEGPPLSLAELSPGQIRDDFQSLLQTHDIPVYFDHRISRCEKQGTDIRRALFDHAPFDALGCPVAQPLATDHLRVDAKIFIDASYEGDLLAAAGCSYRVGREAASEFDEEAAGVRPPVHKTPLDPFRIPGNPDSGLLKWVEDDHGKPVGAADGYTQAYNYRYYTTDDPQHRLPITPPENYDPQDYELIGRYVAYLVEQKKHPESLRRSLVAICPGWMNARDWNYQRSSLISMSPLGISHRYADGDAAEKAAVWKQHQDYLRGLFHFMRTDARVPQAYRDELAQLGLDRRVHPETGGWPHQLYIRVSRRLLGRYTITAHDVYNRTKVDDSIGLAQYGIDTYPSRRIWFQDDSGQTWVANEGNMFVGGSRGPTNTPYPIPYRAITPQAEECTNLLVPICFSASHLGYASARMEPVFMITGESAGIAASQAIQQQKPVQKIDMTAYTAALEKADQKLRWDPAVDTPTQPARPASVRLDFAGLLAACDRNNDGRVTQPEWDSGKPGWPHLFPFIDQDKDGTISEAEYQNFQTFKAKNPDWQKKVAEANRKAS